MKRGLVELICWVFLVLAFWAVARVAHGEEHYTVRISSHEPMCLEYEEDCKIGNQYCYAAKCVRYSTENAVYSVGEWALSEKEMADDLAEALNEAHNRRMNKARYSYEKFEEEHRLDKEKAPDNCVVDCVSPNCKVICCGKGEYSYTTWEDGQFVTRWEKCKFCDCPALKHGSR